ncbi:MAG: CmpA/NrtA family ABC transporter substrate-binding protein [Oceanococcus sp.]
MKFSLGRLVGGRFSQHPALRIGYLPTLDAAVLLVAQARGEFQREGLKVTLSRQTSWQRARKLLASGDLHAAHMPGTIPLCAHLGIGGPRVPLRTAFVLSLGGASFGLHRRWVSQLHDAGLPSVAPVPPVQSFQALAALIRCRKEAGEPRLRFAVSDRYSNGSYDLRYCLASVGIDPNNDIELAPLTPNRVLKSLRADNYDAAWLDEPWGSLAAQDGLVELLFSKHAMWNHSLGKVLAIHDRFLQRYPRTHRALLRALMRASAWLEEHRDEARELLADRHALQLPESVLHACGEGISTLAGTHSRDLVFHQVAANFPWYSHAVWYLGQMIRWGDFDQVLDFKKTAQEVYLPKIYREVARELDMAYPSMGYKDEGVHDQDWHHDEASKSLHLGSDLFFDGRLYKPRQTMKYLNGLEISHIKAPLDAMWAIR